MPETNGVSDQILNSWKEIAHYLNRGVRTVQRWESELGLPVRRPRGRRRSAVIAMRTEIDDWLTQCPLEAREHMAQSPATVFTVVRRKEEAERRLSQLILDSRNLRDDLDRSRKQLESALEVLFNTIQAYRTIFKDAKKPEHFVEALEAIETPRVA